jgi:hypothetical protein
VPQRSRFAVAACALAAAAGSSAGLSLDVQQAEAVGPTLPTLPLPTVPTVTVPGVTTIAPPTTTETTTTTGTTTTTATTVVTTTVATPAPGDPASVTTSQTTPPPLPALTVAGARHLASGAVSIPVSSVRLPARLRLLVSFAPHVLRINGQRISVALRVVDSRGYVVRGARVAVGMTFGAHAATQRVGTKLSAADGLVTFAAPVRLPAKRPQPVVLVVRAVDPVAPSAASASFTVRIPVRPAP